MTNSRTSYFPESGTLRLEEFESTLSISINVVFAEMMNPDDPNCATKVWAEIESIPMPVDDWRKLPGQEIDLTELVEDGEIDAGLMDRGITDFLFPFKISFGELKGNQITATISGEMDRDDTPEFSWRVPLAFDAEALDSAMKEHFSN